MPHPAESGAVSGRLTAPLEPWFGELQLEYVRVLRRAQKIWLEAPAPVPPGRTPWYAEYDAR